MEPISSVSASDDVSTRSSSSLPSPLLIEEGSYSERLRSSFATPPPCTKKVPYKVSVWKRQDAEKLGIFYAKKYAKRPVDLNPVINGKVTELTTKQKEYIEIVNNSLPFSVTFQQFYHTTDNVTRNIERCAAELEKLQKKEQNSENLFAVMKLKLFIRGLRNLYKDMRDYKKSATSYEGILKTFFGYFAMLCCLDVQYCNQSYRVVWENLYDVKVTSEPDIRLFKCGLDDVFSETLISVIGVKPGKSLNEPVGLPAKRKYQGSPRTSPVAFGAESPVIQESEDAIELDLHDRVLGQHAGELLLDMHFKYKGKAVSEYKDDTVINMLGMIVEETMVFFTVLEMEWKHYKKLRNNENLDTEDKATIHYTQPKEILNQEDRESLIADFMRLNNIELI